jgi:hypothetical protein
LVLLSCTYRDASTDAPMKIESYRLENPLALTPEENYPIVNYSIQQRYFYKSNAVGKKTIINYGFKLIIENTGPTKIQVDYTVSVDMDGVKYLNISKGEVIKADGISRSDYIAVSEKKFNINDINLDFKVLSIKFIR